MADNQKYQSLKDEEIIAMVKSGGREYEQASDFLFNAYRVYIPKLRSKLNLTQEDINNAYTDALIKLLRQIKSSAFRGDSKISTYFFRIFNNKAVDVSRHNTSNKVMDTEELTSYSSRERDLLELISIRDEAKQLRKQIDNLGGSCKSILIDWGYHGYSMIEIAERAGLSNAESARSMKHKCLKKLKSMISQSK